METRHWFAVNEGTWPICVVAETPAEAFHRMAMVLFERDDEYVGAVNGTHLHQGGFYLEAYVRNDFDPLG